MERVDDNVGERKRLYKIFTVVQKPGNQKGIWLEIGIGSVNRDGSISGKLDCLPVNGAIQLRDYEQKEFRRDNGFRRNADNRNPSAPKDHSKVYNPPPKEWHQGGN